MKNIKNRVFFFFFFFFLEHKDFTPEYVCSLSKRGSIYEPYIVYMFSFQLLNKYRPSVLSSSFFANGTCEVQVLTNNVVSGIGLCILVYMKSIPQVIYILNGYIL